MLNANLRAFTATMDNNTYLPKVDPTSTGKIIHDEREMLPKDNCGRLLIEISTVGLILMSPSLSSIKFLLFALNSTSTRNFMASKKQFTTLAGTCLTLHNFCSNLTANTTAASQFYQLS